MGKKDPEAPPETAPLSAQEYENVRTGLTPAVIVRALTENLYYLLARVPEIARVNDWYMALAYTVRDRVIDRWVKTIASLRGESRTVAYLSAEFLMGPQLENSLINLGIYEQVRQATELVGVNLRDLIEHEGEPGLGNGGLGRLAACYLDSLASLGIPAIGYGIRYEFGIFDQEIRDGWQTEVTDKWLALGNPWEMARPEISCYLPMGGHTEPYKDQHGRYGSRWAPDRVVKGVAYDTPVPGYRGGVANLLRLWKSEACESFDFQAFNVGDYYGAVEEKVASETISKVLYPNDDPAMGKVLRLAQQYFFVSCSLQDMIRIHRTAGKSFDTFHEKFAVQLNDTHPSIAVAELMRLFVDQYQMDWDKAWDITRKTFAYTNHTLLPEALEKWPLPLFKQVLPRHLEIIYEINRRFLDEVRVTHPGDDELAKNVSLIDDTGDKYIRMANLASVGTHAINGVAKIHSDLLKETVLRDFYRLFPEKFHNVTNGVTPRRWMALSNPRLTSLITRSIGDGWLCNLEERLAQLETFVDDGGFQKEWRSIKLDNKADLASFIVQRTGTSVDPDTLFDVQVKRIHEYKRQHLNVLHVITLYNRLKRNPRLDIPRRTVLFGGKAAPGYFMAKLIIKLITSVAEVINADSHVSDRLKVVFVPDFNVKSGQWIYPAADLSEQISTAGKEASGTGNMKFSMNGALTIGTLDGANVEIREKVAPENFFVFGLTESEVTDLRTRGYNPREYYETNGQLKEAIDLIGSGFFSRGDRNLFKPLVDSLLYHDEYLVFADYQAYVDAQEEVNKAFRDEKLWTRMSILNVARMGHFSSDRSIREYAEKIWNVKPLAVTYEGQRCR